VNKKQNLLLIILELGFLVEKGHLGCVASGVTVSSNSSGMIEAK